MAADAAKERMLEGARLWFMRLGLLRCLQLVGTLRPLTKRRVDNTVNRLDMPIVDKKSRL